MLRHEKTNNEAKTEEKDDPIGKLRELLGEREEDEYKLCAIGFSVPVIPVQLLREPENDEKGTCPQNYDLGNLLAWISKNRRDLLSNKKLTIYDLPKSVRVNYSLIAQLDEELTKNGFTRPDLLRRYGLTPALYEHLVNLKSNT